MNREVRFRREGEVPRKSGGSTSTWPYVYVCMYVCMYVYIVIVYLSYLGGIALKDGQDKGEGFTAARLGLREHVLARECGRDRLGLHQGQLRDPNGNVLPGIDVHFPVLGLGVRSGALRRGVTGTFPGSILRIALLVLVVVVVVVVVFVLPSEVWHQSFP